MKPPFLSGLPFANLIETTLQRNLFSTIYPTPKVALVNYSTSPQTLSYLKIKKRFLKRVNLDFEEHFFDELTFSCSHASSLLSQLSSSPTITGILLQLPIPNISLTSSLLALIPPIKDVDGLCEDSKMVSSAVLAIIKLLEESSADLENDKIVLVGHGRLVNRPLHKFLQEKYKSRSISIIDKSTPNPTSIIQNADIVVSATGVKNRITREMIKKNSILIDCGSVKSKEIDQPNVLDVVKWITPVPGGVGPLSIAYLGVNVIKSAALQRGMDFSEKDLKQKALSKFFLERLKEFPYLERDLSLNETGGSDFFEKFGSSYKHQVACPVCGKNFRNSNFLWIHATRKHWWEEGKKEEDGQEEEMGEGNEGGSILTEGGRKEGEGDEERRKEGGGEREKGGGEEGGGRGEQGGRRRRDEWVITLENFLEYENHRNYLNRKDYEINEGFYFRFKKCQKFIYNLLSEKESEDKLKKDKLWNKKEGGRIRDEFREEDKKDNAMGEWRDTEGHKLKEEGKEVRITEVGVGRKEEGERRERKKGDEGRENHIRRKEVYEFCESLYFDKKSRGRIKDFVEYSFGVMELGLMMIFGIGTIIFYSFACFLYMDMKEGLDEEERIERRRGWMKEGVDIMGEEEEDEDD